MSINEAYTIAVNLAYTMGCDDFDAAMPVDRAKKYLRGYLAAKGFKRFNEDAPESLAMAACRLERQRQRPCPSSNFVACKWRKSAQSEFYATTRPTALRTEVVCPSDRCGFDLKDGHIGANFFDYEPCHQPTA